MNISHINCNFFAMFFLIACSEEKKTPPLASNESTIPQIAPPAQGVSTSSFIESSSKSESSDSQIAHARINDQIIDDIRALLAPLNDETDIINTMRKGWNSFNHPSFTKKKATPDDLEKAIKSPSDSIFVELRDPSGQWNADASLKRAVVGRLSLLTALFGADGSSSSRFPQLIIEAAQHTELTEEDLLTLRFVKQATTIAETRSELQMVDLPSWIQLANSPNDAYRATALVAFESLKATPEQQTLFYEAYLDEINPQIANIFVHQAVKFGMPTAEMLLKRFRISSPAASKISSLIDEKLAMLREQNQ